MAVLIKRLTTRLPFTLKVKRKKKLNLSIDKSPCLKSFIRRLIIRCLIVLVKSPCHPEKLKNENASVLN